MASRWSRRTCWDSRSTTCADTAPPILDQHARGADAPIDLVLMWHMHHPDYRDPVDGRFTRPWVYLHALKDYNDMAAHLERHPAVHAVVNFTPVLLDQVEAYCADFAAGRLRDPLLALLAREPEPALDAHERALVVERCFQANHEKMIAPFPRYRALKAVFEAVPESRHDYLSDTFYFDLVVWYHLAWTGETLRRESSLLAELMSAEGSFSAQDRRALLALIRSQLESLIPRYRRLAERGQIELSCTPAHHPIAPLLIDFASAREARPDVVLPQAPAYPGGADRARAHLHAALASHARRFGAPPAGVWPAEGAVSEAFVRMLAEAGVRWFASGEAVLAHSLAASGGRGHGKASSPRREAAQGQHDAGPYRLREAEAIAGFFRSDRLSDLIGFEYRHWDSGAAAEHLLGELERAGASATGRHAPVLALVNDGENAWEYYPYNGYYFFEALYTRLAAHTRIRSTTFARLLARADSHSRGDDAILGRLVAGSWVYGDFSTWIGSAPKNRAWDLLVQAREAFLRVIESDRLDAAERTAAEAQLSVCEASDWFWWPGDYNPARAVAEFDALFRHNLARLYQLLGLAPPATLAHPLSQGAEHAGDGGAMRRSS